MRILHCIPSLTGGGAERQLCYLANGTAAAGHDVRVVFGRPGVHLDLLADDGPVVLQSPYRRSRDPRTALWLFHRIGELKPDIVQSWLPTMDIMATWAARRHGIPTVITERSNAAAYPADWMSRLRRWSGSRATAIVANSHAGLDYWTSVPGPRLRQVIANGVAPTGASTPVPREKLLLFVGRLHADKDVMTLFDAISRVLAARKDYRAAFLGDGPLAGALAARVNASGMSDRIDLPGYVAAPRAWMQRAAMLIQVGLREGHPNAVIEAALEGAPLLLSRVKPHLDLFGDDTATFVSELNATAIAHEIQAMINAPAVTAKRADAAGHLAQQFGIPIMVDSYLAIYSAVQRAAGRA